MLSVVQAACGPWHESSTNTEVQFVNRRQDLFALRARWVDCRRSLAYLIVLAQLAPVAQAHLVRYYETPVGLDGYCPVVLVEKFKWERGDARYFAVHEGRKYLFVGLTEQRRFLANPARYSPVASGIDVVLAMDENRYVRGERRHGLDFAGSIYLFASEESLQKFATAPQVYAEFAKKRTARGE